MSESDWPYWDKSIFLHIKIVYFRKMIQWLGPILGKKILLLNDKYILDWSKSCLASALGSSRLFLVKTKHFCLIDSIMTMCRGVEHQNGMKRKIHLQYPKFKYFATSTQYLRIVWNALRFDSLKCELFAERLVIVC